MRRKPSKNDNATPVKPTRYYTEKFSSQNVPGPEWLRDFISYKIVSKTSRTGYDYAESLLLFLHWWKYDQHCKDAVANNEDPPVADKEAILNTNVQSVPFSALVELTPTDVTHYMVFCKTEFGHSPATLRSRLAALRELLDYYMKVGYEDHSLTSNVALTFDSPKIDKKYPVFMEDGQLAALIQAIDGIDADRDLCMVMFLCSTGIRVSELVGLDLDDVNYVTQQVKIFGKGHKERTLYLTDELVDALQDWLFTRNDLITKLKTEGVWKPNEDALFINSKSGDRITTRRVQQIVHNYIIKAGLPGEITPHKLRHSYATMLVRKGIPTPVIRDILGHENLSTTSIYTHVSNADMQAAMQSVSVTGVKASSGED